MIRVSFVSRQQGTVQRSLLTFLPGYLFTVIIGLTWFSSNTLASITEADLITMGQQVATSAREADSLLASLNKSLASVNTEGSHFGEGGGFEKQMQIVEELALRSGLSVLKTSYLAATFSRGGLDNFLQGVSLSLLASPFQNPTFDSHYEGITKWINFAPTVGAVAGTLIAEEGKEEDGAIYGLAIGLTIWGVKQVLPKKVNEDLAMTLELFEFNRRVRNDVSSIIAQAQAVLVSDSTLSSELLQLHTTVDAFDKTNLTVSFKNANLDGALFVRNVQDLYSRVQTRLKASDQIYELLNKQVNIYKDDPLYRSDPSAKNRNMHEDTVHNITNLKDTLETAKQGRLEAQQALARISSSDLVALEGYQSLKNLASILGHQ